MGRLERYRTGRGRARPDPVSVVWRGILVLLAILLVAPALARAEAAPRAAGVRAAYCYDYMPPSHLDTLAALGFDRALIHALADSLDAAEAGRWTRWLERGRDTGVDVVPEWLAQRRPRRDRGRHYAWSGGADASIPCPLDSLHWRAALIERAAEFTALRPTPRRLAVDLEMNRASRTHWNAGPCRCDACLAAHAAAATSSRRPPADAELQAFEERRLEQMLSDLLREFGRRFPGVELGVLDLDRDLFPHRALGRALARTRVPTADYTECSYATAAAPLRAARARLDRLGLGAAPLYGGLWLRRFSPERLGPALRSIARRADGAFVFTTYSLWQQPSRLEGPYTLPAPARDYARALAEAHDIR